LDVRQEPHDRRHVAVGEGKLHGASLLLPAKISATKESPMCRNIQRLYNVEPEATEEEVRDAAPQYLRKISGFT